MKKTILSTALLTFLASTQFAIAQDQLDTNQINSFTFKKPPMVLIDSKDDIEVPLAMVDVNNDGKINKEEFLKAVKLVKSHYRNAFMGSKSLIKSERLFAMQDLNKDGVITKEEIKKLCKERKRKFLRFNQKQIEIQPQQEAQKETYDFSQ